MTDLSTTPLIFTLGSNPGLAKRVAGLLNLPLSPNIVTHFADGETFAKPQCDVTGRNVFIIHSTFSPVSSRLMDLLVFLDALHNAHVAHVSAIVPYFGYARQDRIIDPGDPITGLLVAKLLQTAGVDEIVTVDFHSLKLLEQFPLPHTNLTAAPLFAKRLLEEAAIENIPTSKVCVVSPDHGGLKRAEEFAKNFPGASFAYAEKHRPQPNQAQVAAIYGEIRDKHCIVVDDIIDTAGTLSEVVKTLFLGGATGVWAAATHGIFSGRAIELIQASGCEKLYVTNTIESTQTKGEVISIAPLIAEYIVGKKTPR